MQSPEWATPPKSGRGRARAIGFLLFVVLGACSRPPHLSEFGGETMGTTYHIRYVSAPGTSDVRSQVRHLLEAVNRSVSTYIDSSVISQLNNASDVTLWHPVDQHFERMFRRSLAIYEDTNGAFNPAVGPLIDAWGFGRESTETIPDENAIRDLLELTAFDAFQLESHPPRVRKPQAGARLNFNAIAEGYAVDAIAAILETQGVQHYLVEIGGEVRGRGRHPDGRPWKVGIAKPSSDALAPSTVGYTIALEDAGLATSGNYRSYRDVDGRRYSHILNPATGHPEKSNLLAVSVIAADATTADAYATALMVMGLDEGLRFVEARQGIEALFFSTNSAGETTETTSSGFPSSLDGL